MPERAIDLFNEMRSNNNVKTNIAAYILFFQSCIMLKSFDLAKQMHEELKVKQPNYFKNKVSQ